MKFRGAACLAPCLLVLSACTSARAQLLAPDPLAFADGRVTVGGDVSASYGTKDPGFYTYTDYQYSTLRQFRAGLSAQLHRFRPFRRPWRDAHRERQPTRTRASSTCA